MSRYLDELPAKTTLTDNDLFVISDSEDSNRNKKVTKITMSTYFGGTGGGDVSSIETSSVEDQLVLFKGVSGKTIKKCALSGIPKLTNGVVSIATANKDYMLPTGAAMAGVINEQSEETTILDADKIPISKDGSSTLKYSTYSKLKTSLYSHISSTLKKYHGVDKVGAMSVNMGFTNTYFTLAAGENSYYYKGVKFATSDSITIDLRSNTYRGDSTSTYSASKNIYVYFKDSTGNLYWSDKEFDFKNSVSVAMVRGSDIYYEAHGYTVNLDWHENAHNTIGARYASGFYQVYPQAGDDQVLILSDGVFYDEDIKYELDETNNLSNCKFINSYIPLELQNSDFPYCGSANNPKLVIPGSVDITMNDNKYAQFYCYVTNNIDRPLLIVSGQVEYNTIAQARLDPLPNISTYIPTPEIKLLYSFMFKGDGSYIESVDYRNVSSLKGNITQSIPTAEQISFTSDEGLTSVNVNNAIDEVFNKSKVSSISNIDLNNLTTDGKYSTFTNVTNKPISSAYYIIEVINYNGSIIQKAFTIIQGTDSLKNSYYRIYDSNTSTWSNWFLNFNNENLSQAILDLPNQTTLPNSVSETNLKLYTRSIAGKQVLASSIFNSNYLSSFYQSSLTKNTYMMTPGTGASIISYGCTFSTSTTGGSISHPLMNSTNFSTSLYRTSLTTNSTVNNHATIVSPLLVWRGNTTRTGGFFAHFRFGLSDVGTSGVAGKQYFIGLANSAVLTTEPSNYLNSIGLSKNSGESNWYISMNDGTTTNRVNTGEVAQVNNVYDLFLYCDAGSSTITVRLDRIDNDTNIINNVVYSNNLPTNTSFLSVVMRARTTTANSTSLSIMKAYIETL